LRLCDGLAQTIKHHTRNRKPSPKDRDPITARISHVRSGFGVTAQIEWCSFSGLSGSEDAYDLARRCVAGWEQFFKQEGLTPQT
jgi:hypothetical protein